MEVMSGIILSDGTLVKKYKTGGTYLKLAQSIINTGYLMFVFDMFAKLNKCNMTTPSLNIAKVKNNSYQYLHFSTKSYKE
jgi:CRISPR/Cas system-associated protein endoribonuclease Cas2